MKRRIFIVLVILSIACSSCFANTKVGNSAEEPIAPAYISILESKALLSISGTTASYYALVTPNTVDSVNKVVMTMKLVDGKGIVVKNKTETLSLTAGKFKMTDSKTLTSKGTYHVEYTAKIYKGTQLIETVSGKSGSKTY